MEQLFDELVKNAFDFLESGISEFKSRPKYSVIHFYSGVELILKARLMHEHWTLIVISPNKDCPDKKNFIKGNFKSVGFEEAQLRLAKILDDSLNPDEIKCFDKLRVHRNQAIHFYHEINTANVSEEKLQKIALEQSQGWFYLRRLLTGRWKEIFQKYESRIKALDSQMQDHKEYVAVVYEQLIPQIRQDMEEGATYIDCGICKFASLKVIAENEIVVKGRCVVCQSTNKRLKVDCPHCSIEKIELWNEPGTSCNYCAKKVSAKDLSSALNTEIVSRDRLTPASCTECLGYKTVIEHNDICLCTNCFEVFDRGDLGSCGRCGQSWTYTFTFGTHLGCEWCIGDMESDDFIEIYDKD